MYTPGKGKSLLVPSGSYSDPDKNHLFVTLTDQCSRGQHLLVPICSIIPGRYHDPTCEIGAGEHEFITAASYVEYRFGTLRRSELITKCVAGWTYHQRSDVEPALLQRICDGVAMSDQAPRWLQEYFEQWPGKP